MEKILNSPILSQNQKLGSEQGQIRTLINLNLFFNWQKMLMI